MQHVAFKSECKRETKTDDGALERGKISRSRLISVANSLFSSVSAGNAKLSVTLSSTSATLQIEFSVDRMDYNNYVPFRTPVVSVMMLREYRESKLS